MVEFWECTKATIGYTHTYIRTMHRLTSSHLHLLCDVCTTQMQLLHIDTLLPKNLKSDSCKLDLSSSAPKWLRQISLLCQSSTLNICMSRMMVAVQSVTAARFPCRVSFEYWLRTPSACIDCQNKLTVTVLVVLLPLTEQGLRISP